MLAPDIVEMILKGTAPESLSLERLYGLMPVLWEEQQAHTVCLIERNIFTSKFSAMLRYPLNNKFPIIVFFTV